MLAPHLPTAHDLRPWLSKLEANPNSVVMIALESFKWRNDCRVTVGWFSAEERKVLRSALLKARQKRMQERPSDQVDLKL